MQLQAQADADSMPGEGIPFDLSRAGAVIDKAIEFMVEEGIAPLSVASALLGGALGLLARNFDDAAIVQVLNNAITSVESGDLRRAELADPDPLVRPPTAD